MSTLRARLKTLGLVVLIGAQASLLNAAGSLGDATEPSRVWQPCGRSIFMVLLAGVCWWTARGYRRLHRDRSDPETGEYLRNKAVGLTAVAVIFLVIAVGCLVYDLLRH
ncbi:MAG TPA: hypothetical protein VJV75_06025 [Candidatus Polarisedimenticolia bacterium]|nr:hypothetical protein [Candidatus Polarisedimenticolia bacterium]